MFVLATTVVDTLPWRDIATVIVGALLIALAIVALRGILRLLVVGVLMVLLALGMLWLRGGELPDGDDATAVVERVREWISSDADEAAP